MKFFHGFVLSLSISLFAAPAFAAPEAPPFSVKGISGRSYSLSELQGKYVVLEWFNTGCPFVRRAYGSDTVEGGAMQQLQAEYTKKGFVWLTVNSTYAGHQDFLDAEKAKAKLAELKASPTDYVIDADGSLGKLFGAKTTPHLFVIGPKGTFVYRGAFDNYPEAGEEAEKLVPYFANALREASENKTVSLPETQEYGCSVKYET